METLYLPIFFFIFIISIFFYLSSFTSKSKKTTKHLIGFKTYPIVGTIPDFLLNIHRFHDWTTDVLSRCPTNTSVFRQPGTVHGVFTANPANVEHMLKTNFENYPKGNNFLGHLHDFLGSGIFNSDGELWRTQRKTSSYEFNTKSLRNFVMENVKVEIQTRFIPLLESFCKSGKVLDFQDVFERFAFDNICKLAFNVDPGCLNGADGIGGTEFMQAFDEASNISTGRFTYSFATIYKIKKFLNIGSEKNLKKSIATVHEFADNIIKTRLQVRGENIDEDLLSRFMCNTENSVEFLRDIVISMILAGRDTTSSALTWFFWLLSTKPDVESNIIRELRIIRDRNNKKIDDIYSLDELREMYYLHAAISEAMRLYPPVPFDTKACLADDILPDGTFVGKGWFMSYSGYAMGRMENIWGEDCCEFKPERWLDENGVFRHENPFKYPIFHAGPRLCLGKDMAFIQMKSIVAAVVERFKIEVLLEKGKSPDYLLSLTLRMKGGLHVKVQAKERSVKILE